MSYNDVSIQRHTLATIIAPEGMALEEIARWALKGAHGAERPLEVSEQINAFPLDGAFQFAKALKQTYGWTSMIPTPGFFGPKAPAMVAVKIDAKGTTVQVPWGRVQVPGIEGFLSTGVTFHEGQPIFQIGGQVKAKHLPKVSALAALTRRLVEQESLYRGKAIRMNFADVDPEEETFNPLNNVPDFVDLANVRPEQLIFSEAVLRQIEATVFTFVEQFEAVRQIGVPAKRCVLLEGPYGTGKTLTANVTAVKAIANGWTFLYLTDVAKLAQALRFAKQYGRTVVFVEDLDRVATTRDDALNEISNTIDGVEFKDLEVLVLTTTNHVEKIHKVMLRNGRVDVIIPLRAPNAEAVEQLLRLYAGGLLPADEPLDEVAELLELHSAIPATIREVVERAKLLALARTRSTALRLTQDDLRFAALGIQAQLDLLNEDEVDAHPLENATRVLGAALNGKPALPAV